MVGFVLSKWGYKYWKICLAMVIGLAVCYIFGTAWFMALTGLPLWTSLVYCVFPFLIGDVVKIALAAYLVKPLRRVLMK